MLQKFMGENFLRSLAPLEYSHDKCGYGCVYCFSNNRNVVCKDGTKSFYNAIMKNDRRTLMKELLYRKYPICISNRVDPFCKANIQNTEAVLELVKRNGNGVWIQTKGGDQERILNSLEGYADKTFFYITITTLDDEIRKRIEPNAPSIAERWELIGKLRDKGFSICVGINPYTIEWCPEIMLLQFIDKFHEYGIQHCYLYSLYIGKSGGANSDKQRAEYLLGDRYETYFGSYKNADNLIDLMASHYKLCAAGIHSFNRYEYEITLFNEAVKEKFGIYYPTEYDFYNYVLTADKPYIFFEDYYNSMVYNDDLDELFNMPWVDTKQYVSTANYFAYAEWMEGERSGVSPTMKELLRFYWNNNKMPYSPQNMPIFRKLVNKEGDDLCYDDDIVLKFNGLNNEDDGMTGIISEERVYEIEPSEEGKFVIDH